MSDIIKQVTDMGVIPVVVIENPDDAAALARAVLAGEIGAIEVTLRTDSSLKAIENIAKEVPEILVGAGTVLTAEQAKQSVAAGARFIVSPSFSPEVVSWCLENNIPVLPGCSTPADIQRAIDMGLDTVKFFPAEESGGVKKLKSFAEIFRKIKFMPTGGINEKNIAEYLALPNVICCGGTWIAKKDVISGHEFDKITENCKNAVAAALNFRLIHVGINTESKNEADGIAAQICGAFGLAPDVRDRCTFAGTMVEVMNFKFHGAKGHIGVGTPLIERAMYYLEKRGIKFNAESIGYDETGRMGVVYFADDIGGFAFHLLRR